MRALWLLGLAGCHEIYGTRAPTDAAPKDVATVIDGAPVGVVDAGDDRDASVDASPDAMADASAATCPADYGARTHGRYRYVLTPATWEVAVADCADDLPANGAMATHLVVFGSVLERSDVQSNLANQQLWIGLSDRRLTLQWVTNEAAPLPESADWGSGEPTGVGQDCIYIESASYFDGGCTNQLRYVCECDVYQNDPSRY